MADIPSISITNEFSDNDDEKTENQIEPNVATDCENLDSDSDDGQCSKGASSLLPKSKKSHKANKEILTDLEDMDGSDNEEVLASPQWADEIVLGEFLDQGFVDQTTRFNGRNESTYDGPRKPNRSISPCPTNSLGVVDDVGGVTDCEDLDASGDEDEHGAAAIDIELPIYVDENNTVESHDNMRSAMSRHHISTTDSSSSSDSSGDEHTPFKTKRKALALSDTENLLLSDCDTQRVCRKKLVHSDLAEDEIITVELSDGEDGNTIERDLSENIDVQFRTMCNHKPGTKQFSKLLAVLQDPNEGLTDVENLNSSDDDDDRDSKCLKIPAAVARTKNAYLTDTEDMNGESDGSVEANDDKADTYTLPKPVRELIMVQETKNGTPVSRVVPLSDNLTLASDVGYQDKGLTDTEDLSDVNEELYDISEYLIDSLPEIETGKISSSDRFADNNLNVHSENMDPVTDTEEMSDIGETRKKRHRHRHSVRKHKLAVCNDDNEGHTDVEDMILSDKGDLQSARPHYKGKSGANPLLTINNADDGGLTDVEVLSGDDEVPMQMTGRAQRNSSPNILNRSDWFNSAESTTEAVHENGVRCKRNSLNMNLPRLRKLSPTPDAGQTDIEELTRSGDEDENVEDIRGTTPAAIHRQMDENNYMIHDKNTTFFNAHLERLHIKGHQENNDTHTDTEYLDDGN